ncbi:MAG TPA: ribosome biogenesis GTPase YlqF, partial [Gammaproteobacteria bacterium]|nr:ribosome biogenesis GTPase YlqF [Gammaproteobacteria bacterium]
MAINWYPGHMLRARKKIKEIMPHIDLVIEVLDARIPYSSENPLVSELRGKRPGIKILNKDDLADPKITQHWLDYFEKMQGIKAIALSSARKGQIRQLPGLCQKLLGVNKHSVKASRVLIMGIPNVGKSTLINILAGKVIAKVGDEPAVTRKQQRIGLDNNIELYDSPGMLWPRMET